jgi:hypothetical protein
LNAMSTVFGDELVPLAVGKHLRCEFEQRPKMRRGGENYRFKSEVQLTITVTGIETSSDLSELIRKRWPSREHS